APYHEVGTEFTKQSGKYAGGCGCANQQQPSLGSGGSRRPVLLEGSLVGGSWPRRVLYGRLVGLCGAGTNVLQTPQSPFGSTAFDKLGNNVRQSQDHESAEKIRGDRECTSAL